jgi:hypothetical protein
MRITVWMATRERRTWLTAMEVLALGLIVLVAPGAPVRLLIGLPIVVHLGYQALTSLPMGLVPRRKERGVPRRRYDLRVRVVRFLDEVKRVEDYVGRARVAGLPEDDVESYLHTAQRRVMTAAAAVAQASGRAHGAEPFLGGTLSAQSN